LRDHQDGLGFAQTVRKNNRTTHKLIGLTRINAEPDCQLNRLVKLGEGNFFNLGYRFLKVVLATGFNFLRRRVVFLSVFLHFLSPRFMRDSFEI
jgi:hypothetical protein